MPKNTLNQDDGVKAIIALQALVGITETPKQALEGWHKMSDYDKKQTLLAYKLLCAPKEES